MELLTKGEVTVTFKSQHAVVSEFTAQDDYPKGNPKYWGTDEFVEGLKELKLTSDGMGTFAEGDHITIACSPHTYQVISTNFGTDSFGKFQIIPTEYKALQPKHIYHDVFGYGYGNRAERRANKFARRTRTDGWNKHGKGLERGKQYYKGQKAGHY